MAQTYIFIHKPKCFILAVPAAQEVEQVVEVDGSNPALSQSVVGQDDKPTLPHRDVSECWLAGAV